jgi:3-hydroxyisobutyrate dehydrogenase
MSDKRFTISETPGDGATMKLVNNLLAGIHNAAAAEALALGIRAGLDPQKVFDVVMASSGMSWMFGDRIKRLIAGDKQVAAAMPILSKDVGLALDMAQGLQFPLPVGSAAHQVFLGTLAHGHALEDDNAVIHYYQALTGIKLP